MAEAQNRNAETLQIIIREIQKVDKKFAPADRQPTLIQTLTFLQQRYQASSEAPENRQPDIKSLCETLSENATEAEIVDVCLDELMIDILMALAFRGIRCKKNNKYNIKTEAIKTFDKQIPALLSTNPEITDNLTKYDSMINSIHSPYYTLFGRNRPQSTPFNASGGITETPKRNQAARCNLENSAEICQNCTIALIRNVSIKDAINSIPMFDGFNIPVSQFAIACRVASLLVPQYNEPKIAKFIKTRIQGEAQKSAYQITFLTVSEAITYCHSRFGTANLYH